MKKVIIAIIMLFSISAFSQNVDGGAKKILQELTTKYKAFSTMKIEYTYKLMKDKKVSDARKGIILIKGNKYFTNIEGQAIYCNGVTMWNYQSKTNEVSIFDYEESDDELLNPAKMLANWEKEYTSKFIREEMENGKSTQIIDLSPIKGKSYFKVRLIIDKNKKEIISSSVYEKDNTIYVYYIDKFASNIPIDDSQFIFNAAKYPKVQINDMR